MAEGNGARGACSLRRNCTLAEGNRGGHAGSLRRYCIVRICNRRRRRPWARNGGNLCALLDRMTTGTRAYCEKNGRAPDSSVVGRAVCAVPPLSCHLPVWKVPGWRGIQLGLWAAPRRIPGAAGGSKQAGKGGTPPWRPDVFELPWLQSVQRIKHNTQNPQKQNVRPITLHAPTKTKTP